VKLSSYAGTSSTSVVRELIGLDHSIHDRNIVMVEDIIDTGLTMKFTIEKMMKLEAKEVKIATMLFKPNAFQFDYHIDYIGLEIPNDFIIGYGLDYNEHARNLPDIYKIVQ
jgi:hypoxanthine phosphoribosyltransferase